MSQRSSNKSRAGFFMALCVAAACAAGGCAPVDEGEGAADTTADEITSGTLSLLATLHPEEQPCTESQSHWYRFRISTFSIRDAERPYAAVRYTIREASGRRRTRTERLPRPPVSGSENYTLFALEGGTITEVKVFISAEWNSALWASASEVANFCD